jgi:hypothetical protein
MSKRQDATGTVGRGLTGITLIFSAFGAVAHHSFAVFFDQEKSLYIQGKVAQFHFRNPHGIVVVEVANPDGSKVVWKAETNSPSIMQRRGWTKESIRVGDVVMIDGWPARDGARFLRIREIKGPDGKLIGRPTNATAEVQP